MAANKEIEDLLVVAQFNPSEQLEFLNTMRKRLSRDKVSLDSVDNRL